MAAFVYIMASERNGTIYVGVTADLARRAHQHRESRLAGFTKRYGIRRLVHVEVFEDMSDAIQREKTIKKWPRRWKLKLVEGNNPQWNDLYEDLNT